MGALQLSAKAFLHRLNLGLLIKFELQGHTEVTTTEK